MLQIVRVGKDSKMVGLVVEDWGGEEEWEYVDREGEEKNMFRVKRL